MKTPRSGVTSLALALLFVIGVTSMCAAKTFVYVSNAQDGNIDAFIMDTSTGTMTPIGKAEAAKLVMPMAVSPNKKYLYAVVRSQPVRVLTYAIDPATGALSQKASAPLPDSMPYVSTDQTGRFLFTASYGGDKLAVSLIGENGLVEAEAIQVIPTGRNAHSILPDRSNKFVYAATLGANQVLQFTFDSNTGKLRPNEPAAVGRSCARCLREMWARRLLSTASPHIEDRGRDAKLIDWLDELTADCPKKIAHNMSDQCAARCPDLPRVLIASTLAKSAESNPESG